MASLEISVELDSLISGRCVTMRALIQKSAKEHLQRWRIIPRSKRRTFDGK